MAYTTINKSSDYFNTKLYTGTGAEQSISSLNFSPDFCWFKGRNQAYHHYLFDSVRGANKAIYSALTNAETTQTDTLMSFDSNGFTLGTDTANGEMNSSGNSFVSWSWRGSDSSPTTNNDGSITSTVSANTTAGFSIVSYTGTEANATVGHGLGVAPKMIIVKRLNGTTDWQVYHSSLGATKYMEINTTDSVGTAPNAWNDTEPTSSVISLGSRVGTNASSAPMIAYCFAEKTGYSKFGSYTGNGNADGTFVYTGFKPAFVMIKVTSTLSDWVMIDTKRDTYNPTNKRLFPNLNNAENTSLNPFVDVVSNGFKLKATSGAYNGSGGSYIYMAFAEAPLVGSNNVPCTAR